MEPIIFEGYNDLAESERVNTYLDRLWDVDSDAEDYSLAEIFLSQAKYDDPILKDVPPLLPDLMNTLKLDFFRKPKNRWIYEAITILYSKHIPITPAFAAIKAASLVPIPDNGPDWMKEGFPASGMLRYIHELLMVSRVLDDLYIDAIYEETQSMIEALEFYPIETFVSRLQTKWRRNYATDACRRLLWCINNHKRIDRPLGDLIAMDTHVGIEKPDRYTKGRDL